MTIILAATVAVLFGSAVHLLLSRDLVRIIAGSILVSNSSNLLLLAVALERGAAPIHPLDADAAVTDPLAQALILTSIVIGFALTALLLALVHRVYRTHGTLDFDCVVAAEIADESRQDAERRP